MSEDSSERGLSLLKVGGLLLNFGPFAEETLFYGFHGKTLLKLLQYCGFRWKSPAARRFCLLFFLQLHVGKSWQPEVRASEHGRRLSSSRRPAHAHPRGSGLWESHLWPSVTGRTSTLSPDTDSLGLALPVAFGCHGSRKR